MLFDGNTGEADGIVEHTAVFPEQFCMRAIVKPQVIDGLWGLREGWQVNLAIQAADTGCLLFECESVTVGTDAVEEANTMWCVGELVDS